MKKISIAVAIVVALGAAWLAFAPGGEVAAPLPPERADATLRSTVAGDVVGFVSANGAAVWRGIPFATPPVGELRWRAPEPPAAWSGVREALSVPPACPQKPSLLAPAAADSELIGTEDCLYLSVFAPRDANGLPVMLWVHGGGNTIGTGGSYNGANLAVGQDVVVITINYRLGPLGWFTHPDLLTGDPLQDSGNYGTLDVIRALEWTRDNVAEFGGDPDNVTLFGESAGAFDTLAMIASPLASGLFHRAISQSGGFYATPVSQARDLLEEGGDAFSAREIVNHLLIKDGTVPDRASAILYQDDMGSADVRAYLYGKTPEELFAIWDGGGFGMISTPDNFGDGYVLPALSTQAIFSSADNHNPVPTMLGTNRDEPSLFMTRDPRYVENFLWIFPRFKDEGAYLRAVKYGALAWKARGVDDIADDLHGAGNEQVFAYRFDWDEEGSRAGFDLSKALGAAHGLEIPFVFGDFSTFLAGLDLFGQSPGRDELSAAMMSYWAQFAYSGDPGRGRDGTLPEWHAWQGAGGHTSMLLDTAQDQGIRMSDVHVDRAQIVAMLADDPEISSQEERCALYVTTFRWDFDQREYDNLGDQGCGAFDRGALASR